MIQPFLIILEGKLLKNIFRMRKLGYLTTVIIRREIQSDYVGIKGMPSIRVNGA